MDTFGHFASDIICPLRIAQDRIVYGINGRIGLPAAAVVEEVNRIGNVLCCTCRSLAEDAARIPMYRALLLIGIYSKNIVLGFLLFGFFSRMSLTKSEPNTVDHFRSCGCTEPIASSLCSAACQVASQATRSSCEPATRTHASWILLDALFSSLVLALPENHQGFTVIMPFDFTEVRMEVAKMVCGLNGALG